MYEYICDVYGLDPEDEATFKDVEMYMTLNEADSISGLYNMLKETIIF